MTFPQRWFIFTYATITMMTIPAVISFFAQAALIYWGRDLMVYVTLDQFRWQLRLCTIWVISLRINEIVLAIPAGYIQGQRAAMARQWMVPFIAASVLRCYFLPSWLGGKPIAFEASGSIRNRLHERSANKRAGLWTRIRLIGTHCRVWFFVMFVGFCFGAAGTDWWRAWNISRQSGNIHDALWHLLVHSMLPPMWWLFLGVEFMVPIWYLMFPPTVKDFEDMMTFDPKTEIGWPNDWDIKQVWGFLSLTREILWALAVVYCLVIFVGTFVY
jgi:hypothetical protein